MYQFVFASQEDKLRVLNGKAWTFDSQYLILKQWEEDIDLKKESFNKVQLQVQVQNLPLQWVAKDTGFKLKSIFADVLNVIISESGNKQGRYMKILAEIYLDRPLFRGTKVKFEGDEVWVAFYFYCGKIGHMERRCEDKIRDAREDNVNEGQFGDWL